MSEENKLNLQELQSHELEILKYFRSVCEQNNLRYFITAGTLLGAVRHKGFIPWDDDVDVVMPRKDYNKLAKLIKRNPSDKYFFQDGRSEKLYPFGFAKLRSEDILVYERCLENVPINNGCYIDIFPLDKCPDNERAARLFFKIYLFFTVILTKKVNPNYETGYTKKRVIAALRLFRVLPIGMLKSLRELFRKCAVGKRLCTVGGAHGYPKETYSAEWFSKSVTLEFDGEKFSAPVGWKSLLENMYGDYMKPPDECDRQGHFMEIKKENES